MNRQLRSLVAAASLLALIPLTARAEGTEPGAVDSNSFVFNGEGNNLNVYDASTNEGRTLVQAHNGGGDPIAESERDLNAQICFGEFDGDTYFIGGEDTLQGSQGGTDPGLAGWGWFKLTGDSLDTFAWEQKGKLVPTYNGDSDFNENYGCGFTEQGNLLLSDVGDQQFQGNGTGQLHIWFPDADEGFGKGYDFDPESDYPFHAKSDIEYCMIDTTITTAGQILVDDDGTALIGSARPDFFDPAKGWGIYRFGGLPTTNVGCDENGLVNGKTLLEAGLVTKDLFILDPANTPTPNAIVSNGSGGYYVSSVFNGVIAEYDANGLFVRRILSPEVADGPFPPALAHNDERDSFGSATPLGIGVDDLGRIWFADIGIVASDPSDIGPGNGNGSLRYVDPALDDGNPLTGIEPITVDFRLAFPDGIGVLTIG
ncbi:MAG: hypothetical protein ACT452_10600 [Microthrixaceae bacterium]